MSASNFNNIINLTIIVSSLLTMMMRLLLCSNLSCFMAVSPIPNVLFLIGTHCFHLHKIDLTNDNGSSSFNFTKNKITKITQSSTVNKELDVLVIYK